ncbi:MAG: NADH-quinone oxidoreductase subunit M [Planctomycetota bacterium]|nr:NADH-quinone oxidoreductase subunit M [Planctomycetota bacterium]
MLSLTALVFLPLVGMLVCWLLPSKHARVVNIVFSALVLLLSVALWAQMDVGAAGYQFEQTASWLPGIVSEEGIQYHVGLDGLGLSLVLLTAFVTLVSAIASWKIEKQAKGYHMMFLLLLTGMLGVFVALDLFLFYVFWEIMLLPMYFLIGIWGGPRRQYAAIKFFLYTLFGSVLLLAGVILVVLKTGSWSIPEITAQAQAALAAGEAGGILGSTGLCLAAFIGMFIGFAVKVPCFPFHTWLPDAHVEAPTPISMILAGVLLKMGGYGLIRIAYPFFPQAAVDSGLVISILSTIAIVYGAFVAMAQTDFKRMIAYSSVSHMGFVTLGLAAGTAWGINGAMYMMLAHGTISAMLFMIVGVIYDRAHHREIAKFGGLAWVMPKYFILASIAFFASLGLPGGSGFIAEITTFVGAFNGPHRIWAIISLLGVVLTAAYYLRTLAKVFLLDTPEVYKDAAKFPDLSAREYAILVPLALVTIYMGIVPATAMDMVKGFVEGTLVPMLGQAAGGAGQ